MPNTESFAVHIRRENTYETNLVVRFEVLDGGMGVLGIRAPGRTDPPPQVANEESGIEVSHLRAGRFVHVTTDGVRQSYAMSRVTQELIEQLDERWITLDALIEYGFRYLVMPEGALSEPEPAAAVQLEPVKDSALDDKLGLVAQMLKAPRPRSVASASNTGSAIGTSAAVAAPAAPITPIERPARPSAIAPALAASALDALSPDEAVAALKVEMEKVEALHAALDQRERELAESRQREADLLDVLSKWQKRA